MTLSKVWDWFVILPQNSQQPVQIIGFIQAPAPCYFQKKKQKHLFITFFRSEVLLLFGEVWNWKIKIWDVCTNLYCPELLKSISSVLGVYLCSQMSRFWMSHNLKHPVELHIIWFTYSIPVSEIQILSLRDKKPYIRWLYCPSSSKKHLLIWIYSHQVRYKLHWSAPVTRTRV